MRVRAIVTDIEGTTSSIRFVTDVLFPYAKQHLGEFIAEQADKPQVRALLDEVAAVAGQALDDRQAVGQLLDWIAEDRKAGPLKALQGMIWKAGYLQGDFKGHVYPDVEPALRQWKADGIRLYVYSSGSVQAQQLLFAHTDYGDLNPLFDGYFDTRTGPKQDPASYRRIAAELGVPPADALFLSDVQAELDAARSVGFHTVQLLREGVNPGEGHPQAAHFAEVIVSF